MVIITIHEINIFIIRIHFVKRTTLTVYNEPGMEEFSLLKIYKLKKEFLNVKIY